MAGERESGDQHGATAGIWNIFQGATKNAGLIAIAIVIPTARPIPIPNKRHKPLFY
jgi:hypothetical protein